MITTTLYSGQGLGNQLWAWAALSSIAIDNCYDWGIQAPWRFKGRKFLPLEMGEKVYGLVDNEPSTRRPLGVKNYYKEKSEFHPKYKFDISLPDPNLLSIPDNTKIDGLFQCTEYIHKHRERIVQSLRISNVGVNDNPEQEYCLVHIRGGDFSGTTDLFLNKSYYQYAMAYVREKFKNVKFRVITNDTARAKDILPDVEILSDYRDSEIYSGPDRKVDSRVAIDLWRMQNAKILIVANSSFSWWGAWSNSFKPVVVAPMFWSRFNLGGPYWSTAGVICDDWIYINIDGTFRTGMDCRKEYQRFLGHDFYITSRESDR